MIHATRILPGRVPAVRATASLLLAALLLGGCAGSVRNVAPRSAADAPRGHGAADREASRKHQELSPADNARAQAEQFPDEPYWPYRLAELRLAADSTAAAEGSLKTALARDRSYAPALSLLSKLYFDSGRHVEAIRMLEAARARVEDFPDGFPPELLSGLALHYDALGRIARADSLMDAIRSGDRKATRVAGIYLALRGTDPAAAAAPAGAAVKENPRSAVRQNNYGITRLRAGDPVEARKAFNDAIALDPTLAGPYYNLAILEKYYALDDAAAEHWLALYRKRSASDPDSLFGAIARDGKAGTP